LEAGEQRFLLCKDLCKLGLCTLHCCFGVLCVGLRLPHVQGSALCGRLHCAVLGTIQAKRQRDMWYAPDQHGRENLARHKGEANTGLGCEPGEKLSAELVLLFDLPKSVKGIRVQQLEMASRFSIARPLHCHTPAAGQSNNSLHRSDGAIWQTTHHMCGTRVSIARMERE
jgi:hypothetical protein